MHDRTLHQYQAILRRDLASFAHRACLHTIPRGALKWNWHLDVMAAALEEVRTGATKRLVINLPPRHLKTLMASVAFPAFMLGHDPTAEILCVSYAQDLVDKSARECRALMQTPFYQGVFETRLSTERQAVAEFLTTAGGVRLSTSITGGITGRGADTIIIDDPHKADEALSEARRKSVNEWFGNSLYSRLNDKVEGKIIVVMQRLHGDDLVGHLLQQEGWKVLSFPAIATSDEQFDIKTPYGPRTYRRSIGDILHPSRESLETLDEIRSRMGTATFAAQYQQNPTPREGLFVKLHWFPRYTEETLPEAFDRVVISCDTAAKMENSHDYSALTVWGVKRKHAYLLQVVRRRMDYPTLKRTLKGLADLYKPSAILIEDRSSGTQLIQELKEIGVYCGVACSPTGDKEMRLIAQTATMEAGRVHLPQNAPWIDDFTDELTSFPNGKFDDQVDSTSQFLAYLHTPSSFDNWMEYARREREESQSAIDGDVTIIAPPGISMLNLDGRQIPIPADRRIVVRASEALGLEGLGYRRAREA